MLGKVIACSLLVSSIFAANVEEGDCRNCTTPSSYPRNPSVYLFLSFSAPCETWLSLSRELEGTDGVIVIRGLPNNSFKELVEKITDLKNRGMTASVQIDPIAFKKFDVTSVPTFVVTDGKTFDKVSGNVSLRYALEKIMRDGETKTRD